MNLLFYSHAFAPQIGGIEMFAMHLVNGLAERNLVDDGPAHVTVVTQTTSTEPSDSSKPPFPVVRQPSARRLWQLIGDADKVLLAGPAILPLFFALIRRKPVIVTHHGYQSICPNGMLFHYPTQRSCPGHFAAGRYIECVKCGAMQDTLGDSIRLLALTFVRRFLSRLADCNVAVSEHVGKRISLPNGRVIRNGVPDSPPVSRVGQAPSNQPHSACFAYLGRLVTEKGVPVLIEAAEILKKRGRLVRILIIGDGPERSALQAQVRSFKIEEEVAFLGFLTGERLAEVMSGVASLVMPSICEDAAPLSVLEQMMQGRLIIGSNLGGLAEEIGDSGLTFAAGDANALADQMERVIAQPDIIAVLGKRARERALRAYTLERMLHEYRLLLGLR
jgi:glycogen(starch) synthase